MNLEECKSEFEWFLNVQYKDIDNIKDKIKEFCNNFCFDDLYDETKVNELFDNDLEAKEKYYKLSYGSNLKDIKDGDDTTLARICYFLIHNDYNENKYAIPGLKSFDDLGSGYKYKYRGDTINTYSTLFGNSNQGRDKFFTSLEEKNKIDFFRKKYQTFGNFVVFPAATVQLDSNKRKWDSINTFRGINEHIRDFFDLSMENFIDGQEFDIWKHLPETKEYFDVMNNINKFIEINFLQDYFDKNNQVIKNKFNHPHPKTPYHWNFTDISETYEYKKFALNYISEATKIIERRADKIYQILCCIYNV